MKFTAALILAGFLAGTAAAGVGPFEIVGKDSTCIINIKLASQLKMQFESKDAGAGKDRNEKTIMEARRIRPVLTMKLTEYNLSFRLHLSTAPHSLELMDLYFDYEWKPELKFRFGQYKVPFTRYRIQSFQRLTLVDWAIVTKYFGAERQIGFALHNGYEKPPEWGYAVGLFSGVNARASHAVGLAGIYGEESLNPSDLSDPASRTEFHPEIFIHLSHSCGKINVGSDSDPDRGDFRLFVAASAAWDFKPEFYHDLRLRLAPEVLLKYRGMALMTVGYAGFEKKQGEDGVEQAMLGGLLQGAYRINRRWEIAARYAMVDFDDDLIELARLRAAEIVGEAGSQTVVDQYKNAGKILREQEITGGFNIYFEEHALKWQNDFGWLKHSRIDGDRDDYLARSQFQLAF